MFIGCRGRDACEDEHKREGVEIVRRGHLRAASRSVVGSGQKSSLPEVVQGSSSAPRAAK